MFFLVLIPLAFGIEELSFSSTTVERFEIAFEIGAIALDKVYFLFEDNANNSSFATFERKGGKFELSIVDSDAHEIYTAPVIIDRLIFTWPDYLINGLQMTLVLKQGTLPTLTINTYTFLSSLLSFATLGNSRIDVVYSCEESCDYYYLIIPFVVFVLGSRYDLFLKLYGERYETPVEIDEFIETPV